MQSIVQKRGTTAFPAFMGERHHMRAFFQEDGLPVDLKHWQPTVDAMLDGVQTDAPIYLMVDQKVVKAGTTHRRPRMHLDGYWIPELNARGGDGGYVVDVERVPKALRDFYLSHGYAAGHKQSPRHSPTPAPGHRGGPTHITLHAGHETHRVRPHTKVSEWELDVDGFPSEGILLASNVVACRALSGEWEGTIGKGGDVSHLDLSHLQEHIMAANTVYAGNVSMLHESMPIGFDCTRTLVRLNVPGWTPKVMH